MRRLVKTGDVVLCVDLGATMIGVDVLGLDGVSLLGDKDFEIESMVKAGPAATIGQILKISGQALSSIGKTWADVVAIGLDTPGPADKTGRIGQGGSVNFGNADWAHYPVAEELQKATNITVYYLNDGTAAVYYAYRMLFGLSVGHSVLGAIVGSGLGGGLTVDGEPVIGVNGFSTELGHVCITMDFLETGQPVPRCNCGRPDAEAVASKTGIMNNLMPYFLAKDPDHPLHRIDDPSVRAGKVRGFADEQDDPLCKAMFRQQAIALGLLFAQCNMVLDGDCFVVGGGILDTSTGFRTWFLDIVLQTLKANIWPDQREKVRVLEVPDGDQAGMRGAGLWAIENLKKEGMLEKS